MCVCVCVCVCVCACNPCDHRGVLTRVSPVNVYKPNRSAPWIPFQNDAYMQYMYLGANDSPFNRMESTR